jgi:hypothetical protein
VNAATIIILVYLVLIAGVGAIAFRRSKASGEDFFLASRSLGSAVFLLSLFGTNMTAFAILGSSGMSYQRGIGVYGLMASSSALDHPAEPVLHRHAAVGAGQEVRPHDAGRLLPRPLGMFAYRHGDLRAHRGLMLIPYIIIALIGGGKVLANAVRIHPLAPDGAVTGPLCQL